MSLVETALPEIKTTQVRVRDGWSIRLITDPAQLFSDQIPWMDLAHDSVETNSFYEPWFFLPAAKSGIAENHPWRILVIEHTEKSCTRWVGFFPLQLVNSPTGIGKQLQLVTHQQCYLTTPLIRRGFVDEVVDRVLKYLKDNRDCPGVMHWPLMNVAGPVFQSLIAMTRRDLLGMHVRDSYNRAMLKPWSGPDTEEACQDYLLQSLGGHHFRELRRQRRRLNESGVMEYRTLENAAELPLWIEWFLQLEAAGWKGRDATALASHSESLQFAQEMITAGYNQGRVQMVGLFRNGEPIAIKLNLVSSTGGFAYKITYNEEFAKLSPGVQLEVDYLKAFQRSGQQWMDSCAVADHSMINRLWADRRTIQDTLISTGRWTSDLGLSALPFLRGIVRTCRRAWQATRDLFRVSRPSAD